MLCLTRDQFAAIVAQGNSVWPEECCGFLAGADGRVTECVPVTNVSTDKCLTYEMHPGEIARFERHIADAGLKLLAIYHTHPKTEAYPSPTDRRRALWPGTEEPLFPGVSYLIVSLQDRENPVARSFRLEGGEVSEETVSVE